jgi:HNH endonuclease/EVE domain
MNAWLLQANPDQFDVTTYVENFKDIYWSIKKEAWQKRVAVGDDVFIWRAMGSARVESGIIASGYITEPATDKSQIRFKSNVGENLWQPGFSELSQIKIGIHLNIVRTSSENGMLLKSHFLNDEILSKSQIITVRSGAVFLLSAVQAGRIYELWGSEPQDEAPETITSKEGAIVEKLHRFRERDRNLVTQAKEAFLRKHGGLFCSVCGFSFQKTYGEDYIEAHHLKAISERTKSEETKIEDLAMVCANCHRMIHRDKNFELKYAKLVEKFAAFCGR